MNTEQAKLILQSYRLNGEDAKDPHFAEALDQLKHDPILARWFEEETQLERAISEKIKQATRPPANLKQNILTSFKVVRPAPWWNRGSWLSAAAIGILALGLASFWLMPRPDPHTAYREQMIQFLTDRADHIEFFNSDVNQVRGWLSQKNGHAEFHVPAGLQGRPSLGCRTLAWQERTVSFICFELEDHKMVHLFVIDQDPSIQLPATPSFARNGELSSATWNEDDKTYMLIGRLDEDRLRRYL